ncbi:MAG: 16S rRNA (guanine(966)-N(2))-methyltransferase RsmD [Acidobacteria bacterium]|nr:16S rRNA (guanine(966)-N(2))-methyltransferase RsmD [Acidobacteriota bacterium]MBI3664455.1 16S rRNA (guanine(966)-N(2))-methyltransferase RsmD [Acidobacteriota bacterium]
MRVVAGKFGSRALKGPRGQAMRPTSDRLRETLFNILGAAVEGSVFVDAYAGTGAVGIEALSRGAKRAVLIEKHRAAVALIRKNLSMLGIEQDAEVLPTDVVKGLAWLANEGTQADFIFLDPPYGDMAEYGKVLEFLGESPLLARGGRVIVEHERRRKLEEKSGKLVRVRAIEQGDAVLSIYQWSDLA